MQAVSAAKDVWDADGQGGLVAQLVVAVIRFVEVGGVSVRLERLG